MKIEQVLFDVLLPITHCPVLAASVHEITTSITGKSVNIQCSRLGNMFHVPLQQMIFENIVAKGINWSKAAIS